MNMDQAVEAFMVESAELLADMEQALLELEENPQDADLINAIFRAAHTIKGSAGVFGFDDVVAFTHVVESVLDRVRDGEIRVDAPLTALLLTCRDHMSTLVDMTRGDGGHSAADAATLGKDLVHQLQAYLDGDQGDAPASAAADGQGNDGGMQRWQVGLGFGEDMLRHGMDPASVIRYLAQLGEIGAVNTDSGRLPRLTEMDPESCYLDVQLILTSDKPREELEGAFDFIREGSEVSLVPLDEPAATASVNADTPADAPTEAAGGENSSAGAKPTVAARSVRIDAAKLDDLINLVGELVIANASSNLLTQRLNDEPLQESMSVMSRLVEEIRDSALRLRMVPIGETFHRFRRVVRDVSKELGKDIRLQIKGADTELDKTVVEKIGDPLMHLVRNAMDHGIEDGATRSGNGKPAHGTLTLNAYHDSGSIVIEVSDDGGGLNRDRIFNKAVDKGLITASQVLSDQEVYRLIFEPGFSTAEQVTNLSGRGVGMDVVRRNIEALRGSVDIDSRPGEGTVVSIRLPLTLGIIDGFLVRVSDTAYVIPLDLVTECIELTEEDREQTRNRHYINLRGEVLPFVRLRSVFHDDAAPGPRENIVVVHYGGQKAGLVVDELQGEFQTVIKPLGKIFERLRGISGSTILGSGEVSMILDVPSLVQVAAASSNGRSAEPRAMGDAA